MLVSWNWLKDYVALDVSPDEFARRLMFAGLNHESTTTVGADVAVDLEVTSNRPDCLGHIGIAREAAVLFGVPLKLPNPQPKVGGTKAESLAAVTVECPDLCPRYTARVIRGAKIKPSPAWLAERLKTVGTAVINNVVDITNYILMENGQPLHAFDLNKLGGKQIIVRKARKDEPFVAIDHKTYTLDPVMCVIADANKAIALAGVMGGADSEVGPDTVDILIESADFDPLSIRTTARKTSLRSPSSYRFERGVDPEGIDWASRRACELILDLAGGELAEGVIDVGSQSPARPKIILRLSQLKRILGIEVPPAEVRRILSALGCVEAAATAIHVETTAPSWRRDLTREIDLVEEVARVYGYDKIPEDVGVPMAPSHRSDSDRILAKVRHTLMAAGFDEAMTRTIVSEEWSQAFSPWSSAAPLVASTPMVKGEDRVRRSLIPSLLGARKINESIGNATSELFETARVFISRDKQLPQELWTLGLVSGEDFFFLKGVLESLLEACHIADSLDVRPTKQPLLDTTQSGELWCGDSRLGFLGLVSSAGMKQFSIRGDATIAEIDLGVLLAKAKFIPHFRELSQFPAMGRDLNLIVDEAIRWADLESTVRTAAGPQLESLAYRETYRDPKKDGEGKKRLIFSLTIREQVRTLTGEEADQLRDRVVTACKQKHGAALLG